MTPQNSKTNTTEDLIEREGTESSVTVLRRMMIRIFNNHKEDIQKQLSELQGKTDKI
jgi:hypothetical protein